MAREDGGFAQRAGASQAAPTGLQQQRPQGGGGTREDGGFAAKAGATTSAQGAPRWETGGQSGSTQNGYDTPFYATMFRQQQEAADAGELGDLYRRKDFTGIVTYDGQKDAANQDARFGDVYESGRKVGNLYDQYDKPTADNIMADLTLDPQTRSKAYEALQGGHASAVSDEVERMRDQTTANNEKFLTQREYNTAVDAQKAEYERGITDEILTGVSGFAGGVVATWWAGPWALAGGVVGATAALMNQDEILEQAARTKVQQDMAGRDYGTLAGVSTGLYGWSGVAGKFLSPLTNIVHGAADASTIGDGQSSYYQVDAEGKPTRPAWMTGLGVVAGLGDAVLQFSSGVGQTAYLTQMGGTIAGEVAQITATGGATFSDTRGEFDSIFTDDEGNFDLGSSAAGIGKIAIDAVQMGGARGLTSMFGRNAYAVRNGLGGETVEAGGRLFKLGDDGVAQWARGSKTTSISMSMLAPSETLTAISTRVAANRLAARSGRATATADDYYRAATNLSEGNGRWVNALVTGVGEGYEEAVQAVLEPLSHDDRIDWRDVGDAAVAGFAMGTGMQIGASMRRYQGQAQPSADDREYARAVLARRGLAGGADATPEQLLPRSQWAKMSAAEKKAASMLSPAETALYQESFAKLQRAQNAQQVAGVWGVEKVKDAIYAQAGNEAGKAGVRTDGSFVITQTEDADVRNDAVVSSLAQTYDLLVGASRGLSEQRTYLERDEPGDERDAKLLQNQQTAEALNALLTVLGQRAGAAEAAREAGDRATFNREIAGINQMLARAYDDGAGAVDPSAKIARQRAATVLFVRNPQDQGGSYQALVPQVNPELAWTQSNDVLQVSHAILQAIGGDFDGDKIVQQAKVVVDDATFLNLRTGRNLVGAMGNGGRGVNIATRDYEVHEVDLLAGAVHGNNTPARTQAAAMIGQLVADIRARYAAVIPPAVLTPVLNRLQSGLEAGDPSARERLLSDMAEVGGDAFWDFARANMSNELLWLDNRYQKALQSFQRWNAVHVATKNPEINTDVVTPVKRDTRAWEILQAHAATEGQELGLRAEGYSLFRQFQKLHYSVFNAQVVGGSQAAITSGLRDLTTLYENLSQGMTQSALEATGARDAVAQKVIARLRRLVDRADAPSRDLTLFAQTAVADARVVDGELTTGPEPITFLQLILRQAVAEDRHDNAANVTPELEAKWARLDQLTRPGAGGEAFVEMLGGQTLWSLLGESAGSMGPQLTVEQFTRLYVSQGKAARRVTSQQLRLDPSYGDREGKHDAPYSFEEISAGDVSSFRAVVEAILETGNGRIYLKDDGRAGGRLGDRSDMYQRELVRAFENIGQAFTQLGFARSDAAQVREVFDRYPDFARSVLDLVPNADVNAVFEVVDGQLRYSNWVVEMIAMDPAQATMHYWRNIKLAQWTAKGARHGDDDVDQARTYGSLDDRIHQLMFRLGNNGDGGVALADFVRRMEQAQDLDAFLQYVNTEVRAAAEPAFTAWVNDVAEFAPDKANGGWSSGGGGSAQREAILALSKRTDALVREVAADAAAERADEQLMAALLAADQDPTNAAEGDLALLRRLDRALAYSKEQLIALGPAAMRFQIVGSQRSFYPQAHTKGIAPDVYVALGSFQALSDSAGYSTQYERVRDTLISVDAEDLGTNPQVLAHDAVDTMGADGAVVHWGGMDRSQLLQLWTTSSAARPLIRAMLFPSVYERNSTGRLSQQFLTGRSMKQLLDEGTYGRFFKNTPESKFTYLSILESEGKREGQEFVAQRFINDVLFAHTTSADRVLTTAKHEERADEAMLRSADLLRMVGDVYANFGSEALDLLRAELTAELKNLPGGDALALHRDDLEYVRMYFEGAAADRETELRERQAEALAAGDTVTATAIEEYIAQFRGRLEAVLDSSEFQRFRASVAVDYSAPAAEVAQKKAELREHVASHGTTMKTKAPWATEAIERLLAPDPRLDADGNPVLAMDENADRDLWAQLADAATAAYMEDATSIQATGLAVPELKWGKEFVRRYWDPTYSYLLDHLLSPTEPLAKAARNLHLKAHGQRHNDTTPRELRRAIENWVLNRDNLAGWTVDVARASLEANQRMDASSAGDAVAMAGIAPRRQFTVSVATARTYLTDTLERTTSTGVIDLGDLLSGTGTFVTTLRTEAGEVPGVNTPMALLNGRFARGARLIVPGAEPIDLWTNAMPPLGKTFYDVPEVATSGYRSITMRQLRTAAQDALPAGVDPNTVRVEVDYLHPDSQPARSGYYHSVFYEGTTFELNADQERSLNATLWFGAGSISPNAQAEALGANKKGKLAYRMGRTFSARNRQQMEKDFATDLSGVITKKALAVLDRDLGTGKLDPTFFNAVLKDVKLRHFVRGTNADGAPELWEAERVIAWQRANPGTSIETVLTGAQLWKPSARVLRTMLGETADQGVMGGLQTTYDQDPTAIAAYQGLTAEHLARVPGWSGDTDLFSTTAAQRSFASQLQIRPPLTDAQRAAFERGVQYREGIRARIHEARTANWSEGHASTTATRAGAAAETALRAETPGFDFRAAGFPFIGALSTTDSTISSSILADYTNATSLNGYEAGWIYREHVEGKGGDLASGVITQTTIDPDGGGFPARLENQVAPGDLVVMELDSFLAVSGDFGKQLETAKLRAATLAGQWPNIALVDGTGSRDLRAELGEYMESLGYEKVAGSKHLYQPVARSTRFQTRQARMSTLTETHTESGDNVVAVFLAGQNSPLPITENAAVLTSRSPQRSVALPVNLLPVNAYGSFGLPQGRAQVQQVRTIVAGMLDTPARLSHLLTLSNIDAGSPQARDLELALRRWLEVADEQGLPATGKSFGTGDILPLIDRRGRVLLYRHGMKPPREIESQLAKPVLVGDHAENIALYGAEPEPQATTHSGTVVRFETNSQYGLTVQLRVPLQHLGNKVQLEGNGMKYVLTTSGRPILPDHELFANGLGIDLVADRAAALSKESLGGMVTNFRNGFAYFGVDFVPELSRYFFGYDWAALSAQDRAGAEGLVRNALLEIRRNSDRVPPQVVQELMQAPYLDTQVEAALRAVTPQGVKATWLRDLTDPTAVDVETRIARAAVLYMLLPQARPEHIMRAGGLNNPGVRLDQTQTVFMPEIFTNVFDVTKLDDPLRVHLFEKLNSQITNPADGSQWYWLQRDFTFSMKNAEGEQLDGTLQFSKAYSSGDNPTLNGQAFARADKQNWSRHSLDMAYQAIGARTAAEDSELDKTSRFAQLRTGVSKGSLWEILTDTHVDNTMPSWTRDRPGEVARRQLAYEAVGAFRSPVSREGWTPEQVTAAEVRRNEVATRFGLRESQAETLDFWVRQMLGMPLGEGDAGRIGYEWYVETLSELEWNARRGLLPTAGAEVPQIHAFDLAMLFQANQGASGTWTLREGPLSANTVDSWKGWVEVALGTAQTEHQVFDPMYLLATDGFMHTFQDALDGLVGLPVSRDMLVATSMMDPATDRLLQSLDPNTDLLGRDPVILDAERSSFAELMGAERIGTSFRGRTAPESVIAQRRASRLKWRKENGVPIPLDVTMKNFRDAGVHFIDESTTTNSVMRILTNVRAGNALLNPLLWVSAGPEMWFRQMLDTATTTLTGTGTGGVGAAVARVPGATARYTPEQITQLQGLYKSLGSRADFKGMIYKELVFKQPRLANAGMIERFTHRYAQFASGLQDPTYGMRGTGLARRYVEKALEEIAYTDTTVTPEILMARLNTDPTWLQKTMPEVHQAAANNIANIRSLRPTPISLALRGIYEPMSESPSLPVNVAGHLIKIPLLFSGYLTNVLTTLTGMQGFSNMAAMFVEGRNKGLIGRIQSAMKGQAFDPESNVIDMSTALDGISLAKMFIQGGITHTGLFALGLAAQGLGLTGEDEEERRLRRAAQTQGGQFLYDPRKIQNDFRNTDAVFLDWLPPAFSSWFKVDGGEDGEGARSMAELPWILKQFVAPMIGMERFFDTGDPRQIVWGFQEAVGSMPLFNATSFDSATRMYAELMANADEAAKLGTPKDLSQSYGFMVAALGTMERMLFENAFVNMLYVGADKYDRDNWKMPLTDSDGDQQYDLMGNPRRTDALSNYVDPETGEIAAGYVNRDWQQATLRQLSENRLGLALLASLGTGQGLSSDFFRQNMVVKQREFEKPTLTQAETEGLLLSVMDAESYGNSAELLTASGARAVFQGIYGGSVAFGSPALEGIYVPLEMRQQIQSTWMAQLTQEGLDAGLGQQGAESWMWDVWLGSGDSPYNVALKDILWSKEIPYSPTVRYNQLNTTYVPGPDGMPWATGVTRDGIQNLFGLAPKRYYVTGDANVGTDGRLNTIDEAVRLNTGMRALERTDESWLVPTDEEIGQAIEDAIAAVGEQLGAYADDENGRGWVNYPRRSGWASYGRRGGGGGGYGSSYSPSWGGSWQRMNTPRGIDVPYSDDLYSINTSNPIIRRATIRRERFSSERGRLNQWQ